MKLQFLADIGRFCCNLMLQCLYISNKNSQSSIACIRSLFVIFKAVHLHFNFILYFMMDISTEVNKIIDLIESQNAQERDRSVESISLQSTDKSNIELKCPVMKKSRDTEKPKNASTVGNRCTYQRKYCRPPPVKKKPAPTVSIRMSNPSAEVVLRERKVEIKDLESQVAYLQNQIKDLKAENKTLLDVQNRQEKELRKFKEGVADIPALLRSHKDEIKAVESSVYSLRRELRECQKELKVKCDIVLRKDQQLDKLHHTLKRSEKSVQDFNCKNKELKSDNKKLEDESKKILIENEELKSKNERMQKKIQQMTATLLNLEETLGTTEHNKTQLKEDLNKLQKKYEEVLESETNLRKSLEISKIATSSQTEPLETVNVSCTTLVTSLPEEPSQKISVGVQVEEDSVHQKGSISEELGERMNFDKISFVDEEENCESKPTKDLNTAMEAFPFSFSCTQFNSSKNNSQIHKTMFLKPLHSSPSLSREANEKQVFLFSKQTVNRKHLTPPANFLYHSKDSSKKLLQKFNVLEESSFENNLSSRKTFQEDLRKKSFDLNNSTWHKNHFDNKAHNNLFSNQAFKPNYDVQEWLGC